MRHVTLSLFALAMAMPIAAQTTTELQQQNAVLQANNPTVQQLTAQLEAIKESISQAEPLPAYIAGAGMGFSRASGPMITGGVLFGMRAPTTDGTWAILEFDNVTAVTATMQAGVMQRLARKGNWSLFALGQAGGATDGQGAITAMFGGGGGLSYSLRGLWSKLNGLSASAVMKVVKINGADVQLGFSGWITKSF